MDKRLAIIVPYRDRRKQLDIFIPHMDSFLEEKGIDYQIIVAEQRDDRPFNRGKLCNIVFNTMVTLDIFNTSRSIGATTINV